MVHYQSYPHDFITSISCKYIIIFMLKNRSVGLSYMVIHSKISSKKYISCIQCWPTMWIVNLRSTVGHGAVICRTRRVRINSTLLLYKAAVVLTMVRTHAMWHTYYSYIHENMNCCHIVHWRHWKKCCWSCWFIPYFWCKSYFLSMT